MPVTYTITPASADEPLTLAETKAHLREDGTGQDELIRGLLTAARELVEGMTGRQVMPATVVERFDEFPCDAGPLRLSLAPVRSVTSVAYVDANGATQTMAAADYRSDVAGEPARIEPAYGTVWPYAREVVNAVTVTYAAGWLTAAVVPQALKQAVLLLVGHWYENREAVIVGTIASEIELAVKALCDRWAVYA